MYEGLVGADSLQLCVTFQCMLQSQKVSVKLLSSPRYSPAHSNHVFFSLHPTGDDTNCRTYVRKVHASIDFKRRRLPRKAKVAWETAVPTHMVTAFSVWGKQLVNFGMLMQKQMSALIAFTVGQKHRDYGQCERRKSRHVWPVDCEFVCRYIFSLWVSGTVSALLSLCCISWGSTAGKKSLK